MTRPPRLHVPGGIYHVILRGNCRQRIFFEERDFQRWESLIGRGLERSRHRILAYCWMPNHVHLALKADAKPISGFIGALASQYAKWTNQLMGRTGHLFERRHRAILVDNDAYLKELVRYIHLNPVRADLAKEPGEYRWSSHHAYLGAPAPCWLDRQDIMPLFGESRAAARRGYRQFLGDQPPADVLQALRGGARGDCRRTSEGGWARLAGGVGREEPVRESLDGIIDRVCAAAGVSPAELAGPSRNSRLACIRAKIATEAVEAGIATMTEVAKRFGRSQPSLSRTVSRIRRPRRL